MTAASDDGVWRRIPAPQLRLQTWPDEATANAYDLRSGETHALSTLALEVLDLLASSAQTTAELAAQLAEVLDDSANACTCVHDELSRLRRIGMVESRG
jgi:PqqD family protein of HPr-rel-A system